MKRKILHNRYFEKIRTLKRNTEIFQSEEEIEKELVEEMRKILLSIFALTFIIILYLCSYPAKKGVIWDKNIEKSDYETGYEICYESENQEISGTVNLTIPQKNYTEEEAYSIFEEVQKQLETVILNGNESLDKVSRDLYFLDSLEGYPVDITWSTDNSELLNADGEVFSYAEENAEPVMVTAVMSLGDFEQEYSFLASVVPPENKDEFWWKGAVEHALEKVLQNTEMENNISLPEKIAGNKIRFFQKENTRPWEILMGIPIVFFLLLYGNLKEAQKKKDKKTACLIREYPEIVSRLSLYVQAGMTSKNAVGKMVTDYEMERGKNGVKNKSYAYEELRKTYYEMKSGISEHQAYKNMGNRIGIAEYKKLTAMLIQQLEKGSKDFVYTLQQETAEAFEKRKRIARETGEEAGTKLLLPMGIMFAITLVIIMAPACFSFVL